MCRSLVDRRWHRAFIFTLARVDSYSLGVGKVSYVSYDGNKQPQQQARACSPPAAPAGAASGAGAEHPLSPGISHLGLGLPVLPPPADNSPLTGRVADNASILEMLSSETTEGIYYL